MILRKCTLCGTNLVMNSTSGEDWYICLNDDCYHSGLITKEYNEVQTEEERV